MSTRSAIPSEMILASAGSGKTWQLTNRFIALMGQQLLAGQEVTPDRIVAVTFTRKAAGEFFDSILVKLAKASSSEQYARLLVGDETVDPEVANDPLRAVLGALKPEDFRVLLRCFITRMPRLFLGTLDSFFSSILRSFPAEFGLAGDFEILSEHQGAVEREEVYRRVFQRSLPNLKVRGAAAAQKDFLEAFRRATFGREESGIRRVLDQFVENQHGILLHAARQQLWGVPGVIWPQGCLWLGAETNLEEQFVRLFDAFQNEEVPDEAWKFWNEFRDEALNYAPGGSLPARVKFFVGKALEQWSEIEAKNCTLTVNRKKQTLEGRTCDVFRDIIRNIVGAEIAVRLERTQGTWSVLDQFEQCWSQQVRRRGRLTFQDMELILAGHEFAQDMPRPVLSQVPGSDDRLRIDYRLDARYDHWLLDEFQDTNHTQWAVIQNLIDEVVQDTSDSRTLFQVGDVKQAIYGWRGGDTRLFEDIIARYNSGTEDRIQQRPLNVSWRSGPDVISLVNKVFGNDLALKELGLPDVTRQRWPWQAHRVAGVNADMPGYSVLLHPRVAKEDGSVGEEDCFQLVAGLLEEIQPVERGLSCAILVQSNDTARELVDYLRAHSKSRIPVMCESEISVATDNPVTLALLSLLKCAAHPDDTMAWQHLQMTPFHEVFTRLDIRAGLLTAKVLEQVFEAGFETTLRHWLHELEKSGVTLDAFSRRRVEDFALAARLFDLGGSRDFDEFLTYAASYTMREPDTRHAVQVMTIHKSKGLTFDCVLLPDLKSDAMTTVRRGIGVKQGEKRHVQWVYDLPPSDIVKADPVLSEYRAEREAEAAYEELCKFYVALTRAKHANYLIIPPPKKSASNNFIRLLRLTLAEDKDPETESFGDVQADIAYQSSEVTTNRRWFEALPPPQPVEEVESEVVRVAGEERLRPVRRTPSGSETSIVTAQQLFSRQGRAARAYGTLVHELFEQIEWLDEMSEAKLGQLWAAVPCSDEGARERALEEVRRCLGVPSARAILSRPAPSAECWREKRFEILLNGEWLSGTFDRVMIEPGSATILDFKTDKLDTVEALRERVDGYRPQLLTYREVLARMTGLPASAIQCCLLFTQRGEVVAV